MKKNTHPEYREVLFVDSSTGRKFVCGTTMNPQGKEKFEGKEYPVSYLSISSSSHPLFTGTEQLLDVEGRIGKFNKRYGPKPQGKAEEKLEEAPAKKKSKKE